MKRQKQAGYSLLDIVKSVVYVQACKKYIISGAKLMHLNTFL